jgi:SH3 domain-containing YSC84-like protein 1
MKRAFVFALVMALGSVLVWSQQPDQAQQQAQPQTTQPQPTQPDQTQPQQTQPTPDQAQAQQAQTPQSQAQAQAQAQAADDRAYMAEVKSKQTDRLHSSADTMKGVLNGQLLGKGLIDNAKCVIVIPSVKRVGFIIGVEYGRGTMTCRLGDNYKGPWSAPSMIALEGGTFGLQIGVEVSDLILLVMNERGVNSLLGSKSKLGVDASVAGGPFGRSAMAATDMGMRADILAFARTGGAYLGAVLNGSSLRPDNTGNTALYGRELTSKQIVRSGEVPVPPPGRPLVQMLDQTTMAAATAPADNK